MVRYAAVAVIGVLTVAHVSVPDAWRCPFGPGTLRPTSATACSEPGATAAPTGPKENAAYLIDASKAVVQV
jgi:hypothetical protein